MNRPLVSIITPAYNAEKYLEEAIKSVLNQTYQDWEMIIVDDGSTDGTRVIAEGYSKRDPRIRYQYQTNQRMASARNAGIRRAKGKYIAFLDADNLFLPEKLETQVKYLEAHPGCGVSYGKIYHFYDDDPSVLYRNDKPAYSGNIFREILRQNFINVLTVLVRKEFLDRYGAFPQGWRACDEHFLWSNLAFHGVEFSYLNEVVGLERLHRTSDSRRRDHVFDTADRVLAMLSMFEKEFTPEEKAKYKTDIVSLRKRWYKVLAVGKLLASPFFSWFLMPLYLRRRNNQYKKIINNSK